MMMKSMKQGRIFSVKTRNNYLLDMFLFTAGTVAALSGIYFLFLPIGGFQGGRNPYYNIQFLFGRHAWNDIHTWSSVIIIALAALHIPLHWDWIIKMTKNGYRAILGKTNINKYSQFNLGVNVMIGLSGLICGISGLYFLLVPAILGFAVISPQTILFTDTTWDLIHTWSGLVMISAAILHFAIHWKWVVKISRRYMKSLFSPKINNEPNKISVTVLNKGI
jgi:hypothetical protein